MHCCEFNELNALFNGCIIIVYSRDTMFIIILFRRNRLYFVFVNKKINARTLSIIEMKTLEYLLKLFNINIRDYILDLSIKLKDIK